MLVRWYVAQDQLWLEVEGALVVCLSVYSVANVVSPMVE